ncbi:MAG: amino acid carrier protein [Oscillospiraceae bacterium]|nr:amino acid carrier protein [Oscillospiraceae bacterium]
MERIYTFISDLNGVLWGDFFIAAIFAACIYLSVKSGFVQLHIGALFRETFGSGSGGEGKKRFRAISTALAASMGTGNIIGTAAALAVGGDGAVLWMIITALFGMGAAYGENYLGAEYRRKDKCSVPPMAYIKDIPFGRAASGIYAAACIAAAYFMGNMIQGNAVCKAASSAFSIDIHIAAAVFAVIGGIVILGGTERIASAAEKLIPFASIAYILFSLAAIAVNADRLGEAAQSIIRGAFGLKAAAGGAAGYIIRTAVSTGLRRGIFSNEAGMGSSVLVHAQCGCREPDSAGKWAACEVFIDTVICCTLTALVLITSGADYFSETAVSDAFSSIFGSVGQLFVTFSVIIFAAASMLGWCCYGEIALKHFTDNDRMIYAYRLLHIVLLYVGGVSQMKLLWQTADLCDWIMITINMTAVLILFQKNSHGGKQMIVKSK